MECLHRAHSHRAMREKRFIACAQIVVVSLARRGLQEAVLGAAAVAGKLPLTRATLLRH